jgi:hypothetical protein
MGVELGVGSGAGVAVVAGAMDPVASGGTEDRDVGVVQAAMTRAKATRRA